MPSFNIPGVGRVYAKTQSMFAKENNFVGKLQLDWNHQFGKHTIAAYAGQNFGAGKMDRVRNGLRRSAQIGFILAVSVGLIMVFFGKPLLSLFIREEAGVSDQVMGFGYDFLRIMAAGLPMLYLLFIYRTTLQGLGDTVVPMVSGFVELALRIGSALLLPAIIGYWGVYLAEIAAWIGAGVFLIIGCYRRIKMTGSSV